MADKIRITDIHHTDAWHYHRDSIIGITGYITERGLMPDAFGFKPDEPVTVYDPDGSAYTVHPEEGFFFAKAYYKKEENHVT